MGEAYRGERDETPPVECGHRGTPNDDATEPNNVDNNDDDALVVCRCEAPKLLYDLLQSFSKHGSSVKGGFGASMSGTSGSKLTQSDEGTTLHKLHPMTVYCTRSGLEIHSQSSNKQFQASMELPAALFGHYKLMEADHKDNESNHDDTNDDDVSYDFTIHWQTFMQCLNLLMVGTGGDRISNGSNPSASFFRNHHHPPSPSSSSSSSLTLSYHTSTEVLRLEWEGTNGGGGDASGGTVVATAAIPGLNPPPADEAAQLSAAFGQSPIVARWLCAGGAHELSETRELDYVPGATTVRVSFLRSSSTNVASASALLKLSARGHSGRVTIEIPAPVEFSVEAGSNGKRSNHPAIAHTYSLAGWRRALQPLDLAKETCLSVNARGILAVQHQLVVDMASGKTGLHRSKNHQSRRSSHGGTSSQPPQPSPSASSASAFCDFLLLPLEVDEDRNDEDSDEEEDENDEEILSRAGGYSQDDRTLTPQKSTQGSLSQATLETRRGEEEEDEEVVDLGHSMARQKRRKRRILSATQETDDGSRNKNINQNESVHLPIGSDDEEEEESHGNNVSETTLVDQQNRPLLFPTVATEDVKGGNRNNTSQYSRRREWERRKRQRRSQQHHRTSNASTVAPQPPSEEVRPRDPEQSANLLDDSDSDDSRGYGNNSNENDDDDDDRYCSSPELIYGQQG